MAASDESTPVLQVPAAIRTPGWKHTFDTLIKFSMHRLPWWPRCLRQIKAVASLCRQKVKWEHVCDRLVQEGKAAAAQLFREAHIASFAKWRWTTLHKVMKGLLAVIDTLALHFDPRHFRGARDMHEVRDAWQALQSRRWRQEIEYVGRQAAVLTELLQWGGSCICHRREFEAGEAVDCAEKGRLLPVCYEHAFQKLADMLRGR